MQKITKGQTERSALVCSLKQALKLLPFLLELQQHTKRELIDSTVNPFFCWQQKPCLGEHVCVSCWLLTSWSSGHRSCSGCTQTIHQPAGLPLVLGKGVELPPLSTVQSTNPSHTDTETVPCLRRSTRFALFWRSECLLKRAATTLPRAIFLIDRVCVYVSTPRARGLLCWRHCQMFPETVSAYCLEM